MILRLLRDIPDGESLTGTLYVDGQEFCRTLERMSKAIPALWYRVQVTMSPKFKRLLPLVLNVPSRSGIRFHVGTLPRHSSGCILVGSRLLEDQLTRTLLTAQHDHEDIYLDIVAPNLHPAPLYDEPCPPTECMHFVEAERIRQDYYLRHPDERP